MSRIPLTFLFFVSISRLHSQEMAGWKYKLPIRLNTTSAGANITGSVSNYPLAIQLTKDVLDFAAARQAGIDFRFTDAAGKRLPHEIEYWDAAEGLASFWVLVEEIKGNSDSQVINAYWGNPSAADESDSKAVFRTDRNFVGVWHLSDAPSNTADGYKESTANSEHMTGHNMNGAVNTARGVVGKAFHSDYPVSTKGADDGSYLVSKAATENTFDHMDNITFSIWVYPTGWVASAGYETPITKGDDSWRLQKAWTDKYMWEPCVQTSTGGYDCMVTQGGLEITPLNQWTLLHVVHSKPSFSFYANGKRIGTQNSGSFYNEGKWPVSIGNQMQYAHTTWARRWWDGDLDEGRFIKETKNEDWLKLDYQSQRPNQTLVKFGTVEVSATATRPVMSAGRLGKNPRNLKTRGYDLSGRKSRPARKSTKRP